MTWQTEQDLGNGLEIKYDEEQNPVVVALFDGGEMVSKPMTALQLTDLEWLARGYEMMKERVNRIEVGDAELMTKTTCPGCGEEVYVDQEFTCEESGESYKLALVKTAESVDKDEQR